MAHFEQREEQQRVAHRLELLRMGNRRRTMRHGDEYNAILGDLHAPHVARQQRHQHHSQSFVNERFIGHANRNDYRRATSDFHFIQLQSCEPAAGHRNVALHLAQRAKRHTVHFIWFESSDDCIWRRCFAIQPQGFLVFRRKSHSPQHVPRNYDVDHGHNGNNLGNTLQLGNRQISSNFGRQHK